MWYWSYILKCQYGSLVFLPVAYPSASRKLAPNHSLINNLYTVYIGLAKEFLWVFSITSMEKDGDSI